MKIKNLLVLLLALITLVALTACGSQSDSNSSDTSSNSEDDNGGDIPGYVDQEVGSFSDYIGWYSNALDSDMPFHVMHIDGESAFAYDLDGNVIGEAYGNYDEQRALNGNPLIVLEFDELELSYGVIGSPEDSIDLIPIDEWSTDDDNMYTFYYQQNTPFVDEPDEPEEPELLDFETTSTALLDALGEKAEGMAIVDTGESEINGILCKTFAFGTNQEDRFVAEEHYAVSEDLQIFYYDILEDVWVTYTAE